jgi:DNA-binding transcriptional LysR family regulator
MTVLAALAEAGSLRAAGERLGVTGAAVSQALRKLEERLGVTLAQRTTRSARLTEAGERLYAAVRPALDEVRAAAAAVAELGAAPRGTLRLNVFECRRELPRRAAARRLQGCISGPAARRARERHTDGHRGVRLRCRSAPGRSDRPRHDRGARVWGDAARRCGRPLVFRAPPEAGTPPGSCGRRARQPRERGLELRGSAATPRGHSHAGRHGWSTWRTRCLSQPEWARFVSLLPPSSRRSASGAGTPRRHVWRSSAPCRIPTRPQGVLPAWMLTPHPGPLRRAAEIPSFQALLGRKARISALSSTRCPA